MAESLKNVPVLVTLTLDSGDGQTVESALLVTLTDDGKRTVAHFGTTTNAKGEPTFATVSEPLTVKTSDGMRPVPAEGFQYVAKASAKASRKVPGVKVDAKAVRFVSKQQEVSGRRALAAKAAKKPIPTYTVRSTEIPVDVPGRNLKLVLALTSREGFACIQTSVRKSGETAVKQGKTDAKAAIFG